MSKPAHLGEPDRERAVALLCDHFARDEISIDELETRLDRAHRASTRDEITALFSDLPGRGGDLVGPVRGAGGSGTPPGARDGRAGGARERIEGRQDEDGRSDSGPDGGPADGPAGDVSTPRRALPSTRRRSKNDLALAVMGGAVRKGTWHPSERTIAVACMGGVELDFRDAHLEPGVTEVFVVAIMGGVDIVVPPGVIVESLGAGVMGGFDRVEQPPLPYQDPERPVIRINGLALMGGVAISVRHPGESPGEARKRRRREKKEARRRKRLRR